MPLSSDPEKRARSLANLNKGPATAAKKFGLPVVGYGEPDAPAPPSKARKSKPADPPDTPAVGEPSSAPVEHSGPSMLLVLGGGLALLVVLVVILNRTSPGGPRV